MDEEFYDDVDFTDLVTTLDNQLAAESGVRRTNRPPVPETRAGRCGRRPGSTSMAPMPRAMQAQIEDTEG